MIETIETIETIEKHNFKFFCAGKIIFSAMPENNLLRHGTIDKKALKEHNNY